MFKIFNGFSDTLILKRLRSRPPSGSIIALRIQPPSGSLIAARATYLILKRSATGSVRFDSLDLTKEHSSASDEFPEVFSSC